MKRFIILRNGKERGWAARKAIELTPDNMFKKKKNENVGQEMCEEDAAFWTKLRNEPYLRAHPRMLAISLIISTILQYFLWIALSITFAYICTSMMGAMEVL